jgi:site-specific DNA recombinase
MLINIYSRKSVYTKEGESIQSQIEICKNYILSHIKCSSKEDIVVYKDEGFSGKNTNRPQFQQMMNDIKKKKPDYVVCYKLDRISRSVVDFANLFETLTSKRIELVCVKEQFDTSTPMGRAMINMTAAFAQMERETIAERIRDNMIFLAKTGRWLGGPAPTGFFCEREEEVSIDFKVKTVSFLAENEDMKIVRLMFEKFLEIGSLNGVSKYLTHDGIKSIYGNYYTISVIKQILQNPVYCVADKEAFDYFNRKGANICFTEKDCTSESGIIPFNRKSELHGLNEKSKWIIAIGKHKGIINGANWGSWCKISLLKTKVLRIPTINMPCFPVLSDAQIAVVPCFLNLIQDITKNRLLTEGSVTIAEINCYTV